MLNRNDFCVFILTHGRPDRVYTYDTLQRLGYTGKVYIVIDDEDKTSGGYYERFGDNVLQFCKSEIARKIDSGDNFLGRKAIVYARNACWDLAKKINCRYFVQFDDDYQGFQIRYNSKMEYISGCIKKSIDDIILALLEFYESTPATAIAMSQGGDHIGGYNGYLRTLRKCMNSWFCDIEKPIKYFGRMNEDVSAYVVHGRRGLLFLTTMQSMLTQMATQITAGGMSDTYLDLGTYTKSFYTVMAAPSCVKIGVMGDPRSNNYRIHHDINWNHTAPKILREETCKRQMSK